MSILKTIQTPTDFKKIDDSHIGVLAQEIRNTIMEVVAANGGHLGSNLGVVELTLALHRVFETPKDKFVWDVAHQGYVHKLLTGRQGERFSNIRKTGGYSGFLMREESPHDSYGAGHAGTALSAALGMAVGRDKRGTDEHVVAIIGDATLTCGITMEALNNITASTNRLVVILNDNEWSIAKNVGAIAKYLNELITTPTYNRLHADLKSFLQKIPGGKFLRKIGSRAKQDAKDLFVPSSLFEKYGLRYLGPIDGHDFPLLTQYLEFCKNSQQPILLHVLTQKGRGYDIAIKNPEKFHGPGSFDVRTGHFFPKKEGTPPNYQDVFGAEIVRMAKDNKNIVGISAATPSGSGFTHMAETLPEQFFDVGIAEEHAVLFAAGLATQGMRPICGIYSSFLQRAFDPIMHDVCIQNLPVMFCMDRAGLSANDGATHHGLFDIGYLRILPKTVIMQPKNEDELIDMMHTGMSLNGPVFIRYPRGASVGVKIKERPSILEIGKAEVLKEGADILIWALGPMVYEVMHMTSSLEEELGVTIGVVNARFAKPLDTELLYRQVQDAKLLVTIEDHVVSGGFGSAVLESLQQMGISIAMERIGWPDQFIDHGTNNHDLRKQHGLSAEQIKMCIMKKYTTLSECSRVQKTCLV